MNVHTTFASSALNSLAVYRGQTDKLFPVIDIGRYPVSILLET